MKTQINVLALVIFIFLLVGCNKENKNIEHMATFAKVYGYVKYFHPSDEALQIDWNKFSIYGASQINKCRTNKDVVNTLNRLFEPIAPSVKFANNITDFDTVLTNLIPESKENYKLTYWQHLGVSKGMNRQKQIYESRRINRGNEMEENQLFDYKLNFGETILKEIGNGIYCQIPIALYCNKQSTFPGADKNKLEKLKEILKSTNDTEVEDLFLRLGNVVNVYNVFQHFYPYFDVVDVDWEHELKKAIKQSYSDKTSEDHLITLEQLTAPLKDGHISVNNPSIKNYFIPPLSWEWIENKLVITQVYDNYYGIKIGDVVTHIDNQESADFFNDVYGRISGGTKGWLHYRANIKSLLGQKDSKMILTINGENIELERNANGYQKYEHKAAYQKLDSGIWYLNFDVIEMDAINNLLPQLEQCDAIICDLRGYPNSNHDFINYLMPIDDTTQVWMQVPKIVYPDHDRIIGYQNFSWVEHMKAKQPYLGDKKVVFIIDGQVISYAESFMGYIEGYKLATIVGQPTAGTNGNVNPFRLPGGYNISWTGMKVIKHNGSQHHGIGIIPDIYVEKTIQGIKEGRDEFLEKALDVVAHL